MRSKKVDDYLVIYFDGRMDMAFLRSGIEEKLAEVLAPDDVKKVIIDLEKVEYVSSSGLRVLINTLRTLKGKGGFMRLSAMNDEVKKIFKAAQVYSLFEIFDTLDKALQD